jgi:hypothetical protein
MSTLVPVVFFFPKGVVFHMSAKTKKRCIGLGLVAGAGESLLWMWLSISQGMLTNTGAAFWWMLLIQWVAIAGDIVALITGIFLVLNPDGQLA